MKVQKAAEIRQTIKFLLGEEDYSEEVEEVLDMAIKVLEQEPKRGEWIDHTDEGFVECPFCHSATTCEDNIDELKFCFSCGARMETEQ